MKKALFLSYFWPPSGKASLLQPLRLVSYLPDFQIIPTVVTVKEETFTEKDSSLLSLVPTDLRVIRTKSWEPFNLYRKFLGKSKDEKLFASETISNDNSSPAHKFSVWLRMNLFVPDARIGWYPYAVNEGSKLLARGKFDFIITNGPPHSTHLIGKTLSKAFKIPLISIFIDPWTDIAYYQGMKRSRITVALDNKFEKDVVTHASLLFFATPATRGNFIEKYPAFRNKMHVMYWGYDADAFKGINIAANQQFGYKTITHAGNIFDYQNPARFWQMISKRIAGGESYKICFIGSVSPMVKKSITEYGLDNVTEYLGFLPYKDMLQHIQNSDYLLVCATEKRHIPGKLFEYMHTGNPIIAFADENPDIEYLLNKTGSGRVYSYNESGNTFFDNFTAKPRYTKEALQFDRKVLTAQFAELLNQL